MRLLFSLKLIFLLLLSYDSNSQSKYWIEAMDVERFNKLVTIQLEPEVCSDWLNACSYNLSNDQVEQLRSAKITLTRVQSYQPSSSSSNTELLSFALEQIEAQSFIDAGLDGKGVKIGIIDGGFLKADQSESLSSLFANDQIKYYRDFITPDLEMYGGIAGLDDSHGTEVWQLIGGKSAKKKVQFGMATGATYYLARTDHGGYEKRIEEDYIIAAMEEMVAMGVKLFNISLGYTFGYNNPTENYKIEDVDGKTSMLTRALDLAAAEKGLLFVISAGNDGAEKWKTLSIPADAKNVLTVGASKFNVFDKMDYSSIGPSTLPYIKPNISVYSTMGTSFSAPVITGLAACIWQYDSTLSNFEIIEIIEKSANFYPNGNNYLGYGVPNCPNIFKILQGKENTIERPEQIISAKKSYVLRAPMSNKSVVVYHKRNNWMVSESLFYKPKSDKLTIKQQEGCNQTSVLIEKKVIEITWTNNLD
jgi:subtilisin family serine protease